MTTSHSILIFCVQVGFFSGICLPCYELMVRLLPGAAPMLEHCADNLASWKQLSEERKAEIQRAKEGK